MPLNVKVNLSQCGVSLKWCKKYKCQKIYLKENVKEIIWKYI